MAAAKKKAKKKPNRPSKSVKYTKPLEEVPTFYVNNTHMTISTYDFKLTLGQLVEPTESGVLVDPQVAIFMSPQHAQAVVDLLTNQIKIYEEKFGQTLSINPSVE